MTDELIAALRPFAAIANVIDKGGQKLDRQTRIPVRLLHLRRASKAYNAATALGRSETYELMQQIATKYKKALVSLANK